MTTFDLTDPRRTMIGMAQRIKPHDVGLSERLHDLAKFAKSAGTMRAWFDQNNGQTVTTVQVTEHSVWAPTGREVDSSRATYVTLNGSRRDYAGMRVVATSPDGLIVTDGHAVVAYLPEH